MVKRIITISREFGSGGRFIGEEVAKKLGIAYYDKNIQSDSGRIRTVTGLYSGKCRIIAKERTVCLCICRTGYHGKIFGRYGI